MFLRKVFVPMFAVMTLAIATPARAAKPIDVQVVPTMLPGIAADGTVDIVSPGVPALATYSIYEERRGGYRIEIEAEGVVPNLSESKFKAKDPEELGFPLPPEELFQLEKFLYKVNKNGDATLKIVAFTEELPV